MLTTAEIARDILLSLVGKSGVREFEDSAARTAMVLAAREMAELLLLGSESEIMAAAKLLVQELDGTPKQIVFADHAGDFSPTAANDLRKTTDGTQELDVQLSLASLASVAIGSATTTAARQSTKFDFGENRAEEYAVRLAIELAATPTAGNTILVYFAPSLSATAGTGNAGGISGADSAFTGYSSNNDASLNQLQLIGVATVTAQASATVQVIECGSFRPTERYGSLVVRNAAGSAVHSDDVECHVVLDPIVGESQ